MIGDLEDIVSNGNMEYHENMEYDENILINTLNNLHHWIIAVYNENKEQLKEKEIIRKLRNEVPRKIQENMHPHKLQIKKTTLLFHYKKLLAQNKVKENGILPMILMKKPSNDISGINQITILTSPRPNGQSFSCKHDCFYCPNEPAHEGNNWTPQPRSYLSKEPAVQRANRNNFHPYKQTYNRLNSLFICGHKCDKLEFIIEGGTFTEYPKKYLQWFFTQFIYCVNVYFDNTPHREPYSLEREIEINQNSKCRIIGICIETRPDAVLEMDEDGVPWLKTLLCWGVTRIQLGLQHIDNYILKKINRGHDVKQAIKAIEICKNNCFKIDIHLMPDLPYSTPEIDKVMFDVVYEKEDFQPDQIKIYPCEVVPWTKIEKWYNEGLYHPYGKTTHLMEDVIKYAMTRCKPWIRLPRVVRDIPETYISGGLKCGNMRQVINDKLHKDNQSSMDIRFREIERHPEYDLNDARLFCRKYRASNGTEYFISFESFDNKAIFGFIRLRIPDKYSNKTTEVMYKNTLKRHGLIRELHVYGSVQNVGHFETLCGTNTSQNNEYQHRGLGKKLLQEAENIAFYNGLWGVVVISGIGVREYYKKLGYYYQDNYMVKDFAISVAFHSLCMHGIVLIVVLFIFDLLKAFR